MSQLESSIAALRAAGEGDDASLAATTRVRVQRSLARRAKSRRRLVQSSLIVSVLLVSTLSWAWSTGRLPNPFRSEPVDAPAAKDDPPSMIQTAAITPKPRPTPEVTPAVLQFELAHAREALPLVAAGPAEPRTVTIAPVEPLYREAHEAHFRGGDPAKALAAWDAYLATDPTGRFAIEARYNRGLMLARLARYAEARAALAPFAGGEIEGGYRRAEAKALVDRIDQLSVNGSAGSGD